MMLERYVRVSVDVIVSECDQRQKMGEGFMFDSLLAPKTDPTEFEDAEARGRNEKCDMDECFLVEWVALRCPSGWMK
jgi:hypothetical protein